MTAKYPLESLVQLRAAAVDQARTALAEALEARARAETALAEANLAEQRFLEASQRVQSNEVEALHQGALRASDLAQGQAFQLASSLELERLRGVTERATRAHASAHANAEVARATLAQAQAEAEAVERDRQKFVAAARRERDAKEDEAAEEAAAGRGVVATARQKVGRSS